MSSTIARKRAGKSLVDVSAESVFVVDVEGDLAEPTENEPATLANVHALASELFEIGAFDKSTMRKFDELCLTPVRPMAPQEIKELRAKAGVSQAVLARMLNVTTNAVGQWERGEKRPTGSALKLLALLRERGIGAVL